MYSGSLQSRIAEKNLKENIHTKIEQNQKNKKPTKPKLWGWLKSFWFFGFTVCLFGFLVPYHFFPWKKMVFQPKTKKHLEKDCFSNQKPKKGKRWFFNRKPKKWTKMVFQPKTKKMETDCFSTKNQKTHGKSWYGTKKPRNTL